MLRIGSCFICLLPWQGSKPIFMSFSDTESVFIDEALLLEIDFTGKSFSLND